MNEIGLELIAFLFLSSHPRFGLWDEKQQEEMLKSDNLDRDHHLKLGEVNLVRESIILFYIS
jgi:hypothetical protein